MNIKRFKDFLYKNKIVVASILCIFLIVGYVYIYKNTPVNYHAVLDFIKKEIISNKKSIFIGDTKILVDFADTQEKRARGLSNTLQLSSQEGMLFVFEESDFHGFWMKDMNFDLDIIWFNKDKEIIYFVQNAKPESFPETFIPPKKSLYVLEVPAGFVKKHNLKIGDKIDF